jgi:hypothetical protein
LPVIATFRLEELHPKQPQFDALAAKLISCAFGDPRCGEDHSYKDPHTNMAKAAPYVTAPPQPPGGASGGSGPPLSITQSIRILTTGALMTCQ